jgi:hypothetical protein
VTENVDVQGVEIREDTLVIRTRNPLRFFGRVGDLARDQGIDVRRMQTLDAGADAVFDYLQQGRP